jgi:hypothetical protein
MALAELSVSVGCRGQSNRAAQTGGPKPNDGLADLRELLKEAAASKSPLPKNVADLEPHEGPHPAATAFLQNGSIVYLWGSGIRSDPGADSTVIAYEAQAASQGGWVLLQDGSIKQMTADEFKAAKKAKG